MSVETQVGDQVGGVASNDGKDHNKKLRLTLNTDALAALIGGNSDVEVEIRNGVVQEFARRHLKGIANEEIFERATKTAIDVCRHTASELMRQYFNSSNGHSWKFMWQPNAELMTSIRKAVADTVGDMIDKTVNDAITNINIQKIIHETVDAKATSRINAAVSARLNTILSEVQQKLADSKSV